ncbi:type I-C CRISPR-associated endonuclease Cas1c [Plasticicumulans acidivorans]|uniref:CRISPR-associated endonuclease Cas1 n=1 Tax=Plasticicumulans acidivorans TaxID=886464 RepID=A0A317MVM1_9GAMM|nr:type I-C CRISPR-associated endonuclease Cas1c [Plasticicumulans acidivorans]PWV62412.1 CRISPR-associated Cas1 family protein [Plasticicumulans acidivorans]
MRQLLNTLYVTTPNAWLRLEGDTLVAEIEREKKLQVPLHHLGGIVTFGDVMLTPALLHRCADDGRSVALLDRNGRFKARLEGPVNGNILLRQAQHAAAADVPQTLALARTCVAGKLRNSRQLLLRGARETDDDAERTQLRQAAALIAAHLRRLPHSPDLDTVRGLEGDAARLYFEALEYVIRPAQRTAFGFSRRSRRPPLDCFNALISFLYTLLTHDCRSALEGVGLDPQLGFLHVVRPGRPALALDLVEEFRAPLADRLALTLINRGQLDTRDFEQRPGGAVYLNDDGRRSVITAYQQRKQEEVRHPLLKAPVPIGLLAHLQARLLARRLRGDLVDYLPYLQR